MAIIFGKKQGTTVPQPNAGQSTFYVDTTDNLPKVKDGDTGSVTALGAGIASPTQAGLLSASGYNYMMANQVARILVTANQWSNLACDGVTDDAPALNLLYQNAPDHSTLYWPDGSTTLLGSTVFIPAGKHFGHHGGGQQKTFLVTSHQTADMIVVGDWQSTFEGLSFASLSFTVVGNQALTGATQTLNITGGAGLPATGTVTIPTSPANGSTASWTTFTYTARTATTLTGVANGVGSGYTGIPFGGAAVNGSGYMRTGGYAINASTNTGIFIRDCDFTGMYNGVRLDGTLCSIRDSQFSNTINFDMQFNGANVNSIVHNVTCDGSPPAVAHVEVNQCGSLLISDCDLIRANNNMRLNPSSTGAGVFGVYAMNTYFDTPVAGSSVRLTGNGYIQRVKFTSCWFSSAPTGYYGIEMTSTAATLPTAIDVFNCDLYANTAGGVYANGVQDFAVDGCRIAGTAVGILVNASAGAVTKLRASHNTITGTGGFAAPTTGIQINAGTYNSYQIDNNDLRCTNPIVDNGTGVKSIRNNIGLPLTPVANPAAQVLPAAATYVTPSFPIAANSLRVGANFEFRLFINQAAGATASTTTIAPKFGTAGTTADASITTLAATGTTAAGSAEVIVRMAVRSVGTSGVIVSSAHFVNAGSTGFANTPTGVAVATATINTTVNNYIGVALTATVANITTVQTAIPVLSGQ